uniref:Uncharacterized protein n=1 Tax=Solanum tuberosum TaxID=4113 RepID=M1AWN9_SOLTU
MVSLGISDLWWILDILDRNDTEEERQVSLFDAVDDSSALAKKAHGSLNGGNNMTPDQQVVRKTFSQRFYEFWRRGRLFWYGIKKRSSQDD